MIAAPAAPIDGSLVIRSQAGDREAIGELAEWVRPIVQGYASRFFSDSTRGEDVAQIALMKIIARVGDVRSPAAFPAWLLRVVRNECINELSRQRHAQLPLSILAAEGTQIQAPAGGDDDPEETLVRRELQGLVREVAATLPAHHREVLVMRALEDRSYEEVSAALDVPLSVARLRYFRACERFRSAFVTRLVARRGVSVPCRETGAAIAAMIEGTLPAADRPRVQEHLAGCHVCRQTEDELRNTAFRAPARGFIIGLGLLRLGWRLPQRIRDGVSHAPHAVGKLAVTGVGGVAVATAVVAGSPILPTPALANDSGPAGHLRLSGASTGHSGGVVLVSDPMQTAASAGAPQGLAGVPDLTGMDNLALVIQRLNDISPSILHLSSLRLVPQTEAALARHADGARTAAAGTVDELAAEQQRAQEKARQQREQQQQQQARQAHQQPALNGPPPNGQPASSGNPAPGTPSGAGAPAPAPGSPQQGGAQSGGNPPPNLH